MMNREEEKGLIDRGGAIPCLTANLHSPKPDGSLPVLGHAWSFLRDRK